MRTGMVISAIILVVVIAGGVLNAELMKDLSQRYLAASEEIRALIESENWPRAAEVAGAYHQRWDETLKWLQMLMDHEDGDDVTYALIQIEAGIDSGDLGMCLLGCSELGEAARHLYHRDAFSVGNVL